MTRVPFYRPSVGPGEIEEVVSTLKSGWLTTGQKTKQFESDFSSYVAQKHSIAVNSCTAALHLALEAIGVREGDSVLVPTMTFAATAEVVRYLGANPVLVDCYEEDFNLDVEHAEVRIQSTVSAGGRVVAMIPVHYAGQVGNVEGYTALARKYGLKVIEDAAHCCPAYFRGTSFPAGTQGDERLGEWLPVGSSADITCFSFYANKCITTGEGGMACTQNDAYADRMRIMSLHGISRDAWKRFTGEGSWYYEIIAPGYKYNLTDIASAMGIHQLRRSNDLHAQRMALASRYREELGDLEEIQLPVAKSDRIHSWHLYVVRIKPGVLSIDRSEFVEKMKQAGIVCSVHYLPLHMHPYYRDKFGYRPEDLPRMVAAYPGIFTLPLFPDMTDEEFNHVCETVRSLVLQYRKVAVPVA